MKTTGGSPTSNMKLPVDQLFKIHYLDSSKSENKIILFSGNNDPYQLSEMFSEDEIADIELNNVDVVFSSHQIYKDDTIRSIKKKIVSEIGTNIVSYPELYLFSKVRSDLSLFHIYNVLTHDNQTSMDSVILGQLLQNLGIRDVNLINNIPIQESYSYQDLVKYIPSIEGKQEQWIPIGPRFTNNKPELLFQANPYNIINAENNPFHHTNDNPLISFENNVLLSYGNLINNTLYVTTTADVLKYSQTIGLSDEYVIGLYFPLLEKEGVSTGNDLVTKKQNLLVENEKLFDKSFLKTEENLRTIYQIYNNGKRGDIEYSQNGIQMIEFTIHPASSVKLPLDVIFKTLHATPSIQFIKYNPGIRFEKIYRAYSKQVTKTGQQIPFLSKEHIMKYSKTIGKTNQISLIIQESIQDHLFDIIISINQNGNIDVLCDLTLKELEIPRSVVKFSLPNVRDLELLLSKIINKTIDSLNENLHPLGYKLQSFNGLTHSSVEMQNIIYKVWSPLKNDINFKDASPCLTSMFEIKSVDKNKLVMNFKRVNSYNQMNAIHIMITDIFKRTNSESDVIKALIANYNLTEQQALLELAGYFNQFTRINGQYVNQNIDIVENPGFTVDIGKIKNGNVLHIEVSHITNVPYIELLNLYFDSFLRVSQKIGIAGASNATIKQLCSVKHGNVSELTIENVIRPSTKSISPISQDDALLREDTDDSDSDSDDDGIFFNDDDNDSDDDESDNSDDEPIQDITMGGANRSKIKKTEVKDLDIGKYMLNKLETLEPGLILTKKEGDYKVYTRACPSSLARQPIILTDKEKTEIDEENRDAYGYALRYGMDTENKHWFVCPRYWCLTTNKPMTKSQIDSGECSGNTHEFTEERFHVNAKGEYIHHSPGFLPDRTHPTHGVPCCFSKDWDANQLKSRRDTWGIETNDVDEPDDPNWKGVIDGSNRNESKVDKKRKVIVKKGDTENKNIVKYFSKISFYKNQGGWVFLPRSIQLFLNVNYNNIISSENQQQIKPGHKAYLLYTVENKYHQSFIGCIATVYADVNNYHSRKIPVPTISKMRTIIAESLTIDMFLKYHNGSLVSTFQPKRYRIEESVLNAHTNSEFYKSLDSNIRAQMDFYESTVSAFESFIRYLRDDDSWIDYVYLWDIITSPNPKLFPNGLNMVVLSISDNDITDNVEMICPTNSQNSEIYNKNKNTMILVEQDNYYAIVSVYDNTNTDITRISTFAGNENLPELQKVINKIQNTSNKYCKPLPSMPKEYKYKQNISANEIYDILNKLHYNIVSQVANYSGKIIGLIIKPSDANNNSVFLPTLPSSVLHNINVVYMDNIKWSEYTATRDILSQISENTNQQILCKPLLKIVEDGLIVGILTETNQVIGINPPITNDVDDGLAFIKTTSYRDNGYYEADKNIQTTTSQDTARTATVQNIHLETQFYSSFKNTIRILLNDPTQFTLKEKISDILNDNRYLYRIKLKKIEILIKYLVRNTISFDDMDESILNAMGSTSITDCTEYNENKPYCIVKNDNHHLVIPSQNLLSGMDNEQLYFGRIADELIRYKRVRLFMMEPNRYLNIGTTDYRVNSDEVILLQSILTDEYWDNLEAFYTNEYIRNLNFDNSEPANTQTYSSEISISQQNDMDVIVPGKSALGECIKEELDGVIGNSQSKWKQIFPNDSNETIYQCSHVCSYYLIQMIYQKHYNKEITLGELKKKLIKLYQQYESNNKSKVYDILRKQNGKLSMIKKVIQNKLTMEDLIMSEDYYLTTLDMWILASDLKLPIMLFSQSPLENLNLKVDWIIMGGNPLKDRFFFIRSPAISNKCPEYRMVTPQRPLYDLEGFSTILENPDNYIDNNMDFESYLKMISLVIE